MISRTIFGMSLALAAATSAQASVEISSKPTHNMNCTGGVCTPTAKNADLNAADLANMLAASDVKVVTGAGAVTITVSQSFSWTSTHRLTLDAYYNVSFRAPVVVAGQGAVTIVTNDGGTGGDLLFFPGGNLDFWDLGSALVINSKSFVLVNDITGLAFAVDAAPSGAFALAKYYDASIDGRYRTPPISTPFAGTFEGLGHTIDNLRLVASSDTTKQLGFFHNILFGAVVRDIMLDHATIRASCHGDQVGGLAAISDGTILHTTFNGTVRGGDEESNIGGLIGQSYEDSTVSDGRSSGTVIGCTTGFIFAGGLIGRNDGMLMQSDSSSHVEALRPGGLVGRNDGTMQQCHATGNVAIGNRTFPSGSAGAGGLVAENDGVVERCYATGSVRAGPIMGNYETYIGGLTAFGGGTIDQSFATGAVVGQTYTYAGGLIGGGIVATHDSYATGKVTARGSDATAAAGGFAGKLEDSPTIATSYAVGAVPAAPRVLTGGFVGWNTASPDPFHNDVFDIDTTGNSMACGLGDCAAGITGLTDAQLKSALPAGFDPQVWGQKKNINNGYPYLLANPPQ